MSRTLHTIYILIFFITGIAAALYLGITGYNYYSSPVEERFWMAEHDMLKPSGILGHGLGILGSIMMITGVAVYMIRKRVRMFIRLGRLKHWLEFHIFLCSVGPMLVLFHTAFKFGGIVSVSFWSMVAVVLSGVIGRFIYIQIPRSIQGSELSVRELNEMDREMSLSLSTRFAMNDRLLKKINEISSPEKYMSATIPGSLVILATDYFSTRRTLGELRRELSFSGNGMDKPAFIKAVRRKMLLTRRIGLLRSMQKVFRYWHVAHLPFAFIMFFIMIIHIAVTILFGYKWIF